MAMQEANGIIDSYLEGLRMNMQKVQTEKQNQLQIQESKRQDEQLNLQKTAHTDQMKIADLAHKASMSQLQLQQMLHSDELARSMNPDSEKDGIGSYTMQTPAGPSTFTAPTMKTQQDRQTQALQTKATIDDAKAAKDDQRTQVNQMALAHFNRASAESIAKMNNDARTHDNDVDNATRRFEAAAKAKGDVDVSGVMFWGNALLNGEATEKDMQILDKDTKKAVMGFVASAKGIAPKEKDMKNLGSIKTLSDIAGRMKSTINQQSDSDGGIMDAIGAKIKGTGSHITNSSLAAEFDKLEGDLANVSKQIGGEAGQRLSNYVLELQRGAHGIKITDQKSVNIIKYNNFVRKVNEIIDNETLSNYPTGQRANLMEKKGIIHLLPYDPAKPNNKENGQPADSKSDGIDASNFDKRKK